LFNSPKPGRCRVDEWMKSQNIACVSANECVQKMMIDGMVANVMPEARNHTTRRGSYMKGRPSSQAVTP